MNDRDGEEINSMVNATDRSEHRDLTMDANIRAMREVRHMIMKNMLNNGLTENEDLF